MNVEVGLMLERARGQGSRTPVTPERRAFNERVGGLVRDERLRRALTLREVGDVLGVSRSAVANIEKGTSGLSLWQFMQLSRRFGLVTIDRRWLEGRF